MTDLSPQQTPAVVAQETKPRAVMKNILQERTYERVAKGFIEPADSLTYRPLPFAPPTPPCAVRHWYWKLWVGAPSLSLRHATNNTGSCPDADGDAAKLRKTFEAGRGEGGRGNNLSIFTQQQLMLYSAQLHAQAGQKERATKIFICLVFPSSYYTPVDDAPGAHDARGKAIKLLLGSCLGRQNTNTKLLLTCCCFCCCLSTQQAIAVRCR